MLTSILGDIVAALLPVFFVLALGYWAGRSGRIDNRDVSSLNGLVMTYALPVAMFVSMAGASRTMLLANAWFALVLIVAMVIGYGILWWVQRRVFHLGTAESAIQCLTSAMPNYVAVGLSLAGSVFGHAASLAVSVAIAAGSVSVLPLTLALIEMGVSGGEGSPWDLFGRALARSARKPVFVAPLIRLVWALLGIPLPSLAATTLTTIGGIAGGTSLFITGLVLSAQPFAVEGNAVASTIVKNVIQPLVGLGLVALLPVPEPYGRYAILMLAIPAGFSGILFGLERGIRVPEAGHALVLSCLVSVVTLAVTIGFVAG